MDSVLDWLFSPLGPSSPLTIFGWVSCGVWIHVGYMWWRDRRSARSTACPPR